MSESVDGVPGFWRMIGDATVKYHARGDGYDRGEALIKAGQPAAPST